jgi:DNA-directed RNA polymerase subunit H (RpoH/RPB5)
LPITDWVCVEQQMDRSDTVAGRFWMCLSTMHQMLHDRYGVTLDTPLLDVVEHKLRGLDLADADRAQLLMNQFEMAFENPELSLKVFWLCGKVGVKTDSMVKIVSLFPVANTEDYDDIEDDKVADYAEAQHSASPNGTAMTATRLILVQVEGCTITPPARKLAAKIPAVVEIFDSHDLLRNITQHRLQPKFTVLSDDEGEDVKRRYCATDEQLPKLKWEDPIRRYYGLRVGQILRCLRMADGGKDIAYRIVLPPTVTKKK